MKYLLITNLLLFSITLSASQHIYLVHGYGSPKFVLTKIEGNLKNAGFHTTNYGYRSMVDDLDKVGRDLYLEIKNSEYDTVNFVTHSMGALVVRSMLRYIDENEKFPVIFRVVMITPPNKGAEIADLYVSNPLIRPFLGPNPWLMTTDSLSFANQLPVPSHSEVGIIVGIRGNEHGYNRQIKGDNDGRIKPESTYLGNEKDIIIVRDEHTRITQNRRVIKMVIEFIKRGMFKSSE